MSFTQEAIEAVGGEWNDVQEWNAILENLRIRRKESIKPGGIFGASKIAWKIGGFQQAMLYRTVMLAEGCSSMWNSRNILGSILCARALFESAALIQDFTNQLKSFCEQKNLEAIDKLVMNRTFSTRLEDWHADNPQTLATNILGHIDKLDKFIDGARKQYDLFSEFCHPNSLGHNFLFGSLDRTNGIISLSETKGFSEDKLPMIMSAFVMLGLVENRMVEIDDLIPRIVEISDASKLTSNIDIEQEGF